MTVSNINFDFTDLADFGNANTCRNRGSNCCSPASNCQNPINYDKWDIQTTSYETTYWASRRFGVFTMQYLKDWANAPIPSLTMTNVVVTGLLYSKFHTSFIEVDRFASQVTLTGCTFTNFMMPHGLISNSH